MICSFGTLTSHLKSESGEEQVLIGDPQKKRPAGANAGISLEYIFAAADSSGDESSSRGSDKDDTDASTASSYYDPLFLDDPELRTGKHRTVIALPSFYVHSVCGTVCRVPCCTLPVWLPWNENSMINSQRLTQTCPFPYPRSAG